MIIKLVFSRIRDCILHQTQGMGRRKGHALLSAPAFMILKIGKHLTVLLRRRVQVPGWDWNPELDTPEPEDLVTWPLTLLLPGPAGVCTSSQGGHPCLISVQRALSSASVPSHEC